MNKILIKKLIRIFLYSFIWLTVPISFNLIPEMLDEREEAASHLTPYSVNVKSYKRNDGTPVNSYKRRPSGSVSHDAPYKKKRSNLFWQISGLIILSLFSIGFLFYNWLYEISDFRLNKKEYVANYILRKIETDFSNIISKPKYLRRESIDSYKITHTIFCDHCKKVIKNQEFHYRSSMIGESLKVCNNCMVKKPERFTNELNYINSFKKKHIEFREQFQKCNKKNHSQTILDIDKIDNLFLKRLNNINKTTPNNV